MTAGTETVGVTLDWVMTELMKNPRVMKKAQTEIRQQFKGHECITESDLGKLNYLQLIIKETLRLHSPPAILLRECQETCKILGYDIPKGTNVIVNMWAIGTFHGLISQ
jgi:cytochrome P450